MTAVHSIGDTISISVTFVNDDGVPTNPTTVTFSVTDPEGTVTTRVISGPPDVTGVYQTVWDCELPGVHRWTFTATGVVESVVESGFWVTPDPVEAPWWPVEYDCLPALPDLGAQPTWAALAAYAAAYAAQQVAVTQARDILWALSGRQYGLIETLVRPCPEYAQGFGYLPYLQVLDLEMWITGSCGCVGACSVTGPSVVHLPGPVNTVLSVDIQDVSLADDDYALEGDALYRTSGASWPRQNRNAPLGEPGTWSVTYLRGIPVPAGVDLLTATLAGEIVSFCNGSDECRIPRNVTSASRRGVSYEFDPSKLIAAGKTGLAEVDMWLSAVNPNHLMASPEVL